MYNLSLLVTVSVVLAAEMPGGQYQVSSKRLSHSLYSLTDSSDGGPEDEEPTLHLTPLQKLTTDMCKDEKTIKELIIGRRVGFYKVRGEIGYGTFSRVKLAFNALTKGRWRRRLCEKCLLLSVPPTTAQLLLSSFP